MEEMPFSLEGHPACSHFDTEWHNLSVVIFPAVEKRRTISFQLDPTHLRNSKITCKQSFMGRGEVTHYKDAREKESTRILVFKGGGHLDLPTSSLFT